MNALSQAICADIWGDLPQKRFPAHRPLVAHYTSVETLENILTGNELWFSNPLFMNDHEELRFGMRLGSDRFLTSDVLKTACVSAETFDILTTKFIERYQDFESKHAIDTFVLSFSEHDRQDYNGRLSMWRGYGASGKGVAVVFDTARIQALPSSPLVVAKIEYKTPEERTAWVDAQLALLAFHIVDSDKSPESLDTVAAEWVERLKYFALFTKHDGFREEQEWRAVYFSDRDKQDTFREMLSYAITPRGVEPKLKLKLKSLKEPYQSYTGVEELVERILLGPGVSSVLSVESVKKMFIAMRKPGLSALVRASAIPFRV
jgi:hypothetical protein